MKSGTDTSRLHISKQNLKFSAAHFLIFDKNNAEMLHGHNYQVKIDLEASLNRDVGLSIDFHSIKKLVKKICDYWDEKVLLPERCKEMRITAHPKYDSWEVAFRDRYYAFPKKEVVLLPVTNTSVELLSELFAGLLIQDLRKQSFAPSIQQLKVTVEETRGQAASTLLKM